MNIWDILLILALIAVPCGAFALGRVRRRKGKSCCCGCGGCDRGCGKKSGK